MGNKASSVFKRITQEVQNLWTVIWDLILQFFLDVIVPVAEQIFTDILKDLSSTEKEDEPVLEYSSLTSHEEAAKRKKDDLKARYPEKAERFKSIETIVKNRRA